MNVRLAHRPWATADLTWNSRWVGFHHAASEEEGRARVSDGFQGITAYPNSLISLCLVVRSALGTIAQASAAKRKT